CDARNRSDFFQNIVLHPCKALGVADLKLRKPNPCGLNFRRTRESWSYAAQRLKRSDHQSRTDKQHHRQRHLDNEKRVARPVALATRTRSTGSRGERCESL